jgi:hypothetical protein
MLQPMITSESNRKDRVKEIPSRSERESSQPEKYEFPSAITISEIPHSGNAEPSMLCRISGLQNAIDVLWIQTSSLSMLKDRVDPMNPNIEEKPYL